MRGTEDLPLLLTANEVAKLLNVSKKAVYCMCSRGALPGVFKLEGRLRVHRDELLEWIRGSRVS